MKTEGNGNPLMDTSHINPEILEWIPIGQCRVIMGCQAGGKQLASCAITRASNPKQILNKDHYQSSIRSPVIGRFRSNTRLGTLATIARTFPLQGAKWGILRSILEKFPTRKKQKIRTLYNNDMYETLDLPKLPNPLTIHCPTIS